ncbi:hypothetical protein SARC_09797, partial [Sphaeroforma arctica JP610]
MHTMSSNNLPSKQYYTTLYIILFVFALLFIFALGTNFLTPLFDDRIELNLKPATKYYVSAPKFADTYLDNNELTSRRNNLNYAAGCYGKDMYDRRVADEYYEDATEDPSLSIDNACSTF